MGGPPVAVLRERRPWPQRRPRRLAPSVLKWDAWAAALRACEASSGAAARLWAWPRGGRSAGWMKGPGAPGEWRAPPCLPRSRGPPGSARRAPWAAAELLSRHSRVPPAHGGLQSSRRAGGGGITGLTTGRKEGSGGGVGAILVWEMLPKFFGS